MVLSQATIQCQGCVVSGYPHNETCPEALHNKYPQTSVMLEQVLTEIGKWATATFPNETWVDKLEHCEEEIQEIYESPADITEWADAIILLFDAARKRGFSVEQIREAMKAKFEINKTREWAETSPGYYRHK